MDEATRFITNGLDAIFELPGDGLVTITGAGLSISAGLPSGPALTRASLRTLVICSGLTDNEIILDVAERLPLEVFFQLATDHGGATAVAAVTSRLDGGLPGPGHKWIAAVAHRQRLTAAYTFNFDTLQERALPQPITTSRAGRALLLDYGNSLGFRLTKLHGSAHERVVIALDEYVQGFTPLVRQQLLRDITGRRLLILGYGGWDVDLQIVIDEALRAECLPESVAWVDRSFPKDGGRSDVLARLSAAGVCCVPVQADLELLCRPAFRDAGRPASPASDDYVRDMRSVSARDALAILVEAATIAGQTEWANQMLSQLSPDEMIRERALLAERVQDANAATSYFSRVAAVHPKPLTRALAATRAFILSKGQIDCFARIPGSALPPILSNFFDAYVRTRRTDLGGLQRQESSELVRLLPNPENLARTVESLDGVRLYVSLLTEVARILHENREWTTALRLDTRAHLFAIATGDSSAIGMTAGNIGACYMGLAADASPHDCAAFLDKANWWLERAVRDGSQMIGEFSWALHTCNRGVVLADSGHPEEGIVLLRAGLPVLTNVYPHYAVCFHGELARIYCLAFARSQNWHFLNQARIAIADGWQLADKLTDYDDAHFLKAAEAAIETHMH